MRIYDYPRRDTLAAKHKIQRRVRRVVRKINRSIEDDRFWIEITAQEIRPYSDNSGWEAYFCITFHDNEHPERDFYRWYEPHFIIYSGFFAGGDHVDTDLNKFIVDAN